MGSRINRIGMVGHQEDGEEVSDSVNRYLRMPCRKRKTKKGGFGFQA